MPMKTYMPLLLAIVLLSCKPAAPEMSNLIPTSNAEAPGVAVKTSTEPCSVPERQQHVSNEIPEGIRDSYASCIDKGGTLEVGYCISEERSYQDERLNKTYQALVKTMAAEQRRTLIESQRAWLVFHQKEVALQSALYGSEQVGNLQVGERGVFRLSERANQLKIYLNYVAK